MKTLPPMIFADDFVEHCKIAWRIEQAVPDPANPLLEPKFPWDDAVVGCGHGTALKDPIDGKFKAWVTSLAEDLNYKRGESQFRLTYLESDDGVDWRRPELDFCAFPGHPKTNVLFDFDSGGRTTYASVFIDPDENEAEPYEMFCFRDPGFRCASMTVAGFSQARPASLQELYNGPNRTYGLYRYRSSDGLHWRPVEGPIDLKSGDTCNIHRDPALGYVAHHKDSFPAPAGGFVPYDVASGQVRVNMRRTSPDGTHWSDRQVLMAADWLDHQADQIMEVGRYPYRDGFIGLTAIYHAASQTQDLQFGASRDGLSFWRPFPRQPCLPNAPFGEYGGSFIWPTRTLIEHEGRLHIYYAGLECLHGDVYDRDESCTHFHGAWCRASWEVGRLWAAASAEGGLCPGHLTTGPVDQADRALSINARTRPGGKIEVELLDEALNPLPGFTREDCNPFAGDEKFAAMAWGDQGALPRDGLHVRFWITRGFLYGFEWV
jgi:hypothetical protein